MHDAILTVREAAIYCKLGKPTLDRLRLTGEGPQFLKLTDTRGGAVRYRRIDLDAWLAERIRCSTSQAA